MKRSRQIRLVLLGTAGLISLAACDEADPVKDGRFFADAQACESAYDVDACRKAYMEAQTEHARTAPKFASREACEAQFGAEKCIPGPAPEGQQQAAPGEQQQAAAGGSWFMPVMMGYMMGRMMGGGYAAAPVYTDRSNTAYSAGRSIGPVAGLASGQPAARRGFGGTGARTSVGS